MKNRGMKFTQLIIGNTIMLTVLILGAFEINGVGEVYRGYAANLYNLWFILYFAMVIGFLIVDVDKSPKGDRALKSYNVVYLLFMGAALSITFMVGWWWTAGVILVAMAIYANFTKVW